jgi:Fic family protein
MTIKYILTQIDTLNAQLKQQPMPPELWEQIRADWEITHTYHSNAIEGNTLTLHETKAVLLDGITIGGKPLREHLEAVNHREAMRLMWKLSQRVAPLLESELLDLHRCILTGIQSEAAGQYRTVRVRVVGSERIFPNPLKVPDLMRDFVQTVNSDAAHSILQVAKAHYHLVAIHPFVDGNGRTARLLMNLLLIRAGYPPALLPITSRVQYYEALELANTGNIEPFLQFIAERVLASLQTILSIVGSE